MKFSAVILAGGASRRMGQDKSWLLVGGQPLLGRQIALARAAGAQEVLISGRPEVDYSAFGCPVLLDLHPGCGPLGGMERALATAQSELVLVLAVDLPHLKSAVLEQLLGACTQQTGAVPSCGGQLQPLAAFYPRACHGIAARLLEQKEYAVRGFVARCAHAGWVKVLPMEAAGQSFTNWNSPEDLDHG